MRANLRMTVLLAILAGLAVLVALDFTKDGALSGATHESSATPDGQKERAAGRYGAVPKEGAGRFALPERAALNEPRADLFGSQSWQPPAPKIAAPTPPPAPVAPRNPYQFAGKLLQGGQAQFFLSKDGAAIAVHEGDALDGGYRVESVDEKQITLVYVPLKHKETIPVTSTLPIAEAGIQPRPVLPQAAVQSAPATPVSSPATSPSRSVSAPIPTSTVVVIDARTQNKPAQLLWYGPPQVKLGSRFEVTLKVTSGQPLQASPMLLRFDPAYLEFVSAKPGKLFGGGERNFSYRVNPDGSIFVGASSQNPVPVSNADLLVLIFRTLKSAPAAQLSVSSLSLQGPAGRPIAVSQLETFRTAISP